MTVPWRVAKSLLKLRDQLKAAHPTMSNMGFIGDAAHASRDSDHNPWVDDPASSLNVVTAGDIYHQPTRGVDAGKVIEALRASKDSRIKYLIWNRRIARSYGKIVGGKFYPAWSWAPYDGANPHTGHGHVSVNSAKSQYDNVRPWAITAPKPPPVTSTPPKQGVDDMPTIAEIEAASYRGALKADKEYGLLFWGAPTGTGTAMLNLLDKISLQLDRIEDDTDDGTGAVAANAPLVAQLRTNLELMKAAAIADPDVDSSAVE